MAWKEAPGGDLPRPGVPREDHTANGKRRPEGGGRERAEHASELCPGAEREELRYNIMLGFDFESLCYGEQMAAARREKAATSGPAAVMILSRNVAGNIDTCLNSHLSFSY